MFFGSPLAALATVLILLVPNGGSAKTQDIALTEEQAWAVLHAGLIDRTSSRRSCSVQALSLLSGDQRAINFSLRALGDRSEHVRVAAATTLGQLHAERAVPALKKALSDPRTSVVLAAAHSLLMLNDRSAYDIYYAILMGDKKTSEGVVQGELERFKDPKEVAQLGFQEGLGFVPFGGMGYQAMRELRKHDASPVRAAAARWLALDPDVMAEDALIQSALTDTSLMVRLASLDALAQRGDAKCIPRLLKNLSDGNPSVRYRTAALILRLSATTRVRAKK